MREIVFACLLIVCASALTVGVGLVYFPAALMVGGILAAGISWLALSDDGKSE